MEILRRSGYRRVGGIYLVSSKIHPIKPTPIKSCPTCGHNLNLSRNISKYEDGFVMIVSKHLYPTPDLFVTESEALGVSKRVPFIAKGIVFNETRIYLAHERATPEGWGIFAYFIPERAEKLLWSGNSSVDELLRLQDLRITPILIEDGNMNHAAYKGRVLKPIE